MKVIEIINNALIDKFYEYIDCVVYVTRIYSDVVDVIILNEGPFQKEISWIDFLESAKIIFDKNIILDYKVILEQYIYKKAKSLLQN